jgi:ankyrin repeat protein
MSLTPDAVDDFVKAACVPRDRSHASGSLEVAEALRAAHPEVGDANVFSAAVLGNDMAVRRFLAADAAAARTKGGPHRWDPLTYLCFSNYLKLDRARSAGFVGAATALLDAGADPNTGWNEETHQPEPEWESAIYGAAGVAHHPELTGLLLARGADPNDEETPYHVPETYDNRALDVLLTSGRFTDESLATALLRKADWHDTHGIALLLSYGADPNRMTRWKRSALHQAVKRDNALANIELMIGRGADPLQPDRVDGWSAVVLAARRGRRDLLGALARRGIPLRFTGEDRLIAACALDDAATIARVEAEQPDLVTAVVSEGATVLAEFAGNGNTAGVGRLLDLGVPIDARYGGDGYFDIAPESTALHVAAWRARHDTVNYLLARGASATVLDRDGRTPLARAVTACVDSFWTDRRSPESVAALLDAGASLEGVAYPSGYAAVDRLLAARR